MRKLAMFIRNVIAGYEPALVRSVVVAVFVLLAAFGIGSGDLPPQVEALLTFAAFVIPIIGGLLIRRKVSPAHAANE